MRASVLARRALARGAAGLGVTVLAVACGATQRPDGGKGLLPVGAQAPDFAATDAFGKPVRLSETAGHPRVVYFYPKDETPGCTKEACAFRDAFDEYKKRGISLFGVSRDSEESHRKFREHHALPFYLAADPSGDVQRAYGVPGHLGIASRVTFLIDANGKIAFVWEKVDPAAHSAEVLAQVR
jgi:thioredoxin-dependent peroxiredoxin